MTSFVELTSSLVDLLMTKIDHRTAEAYSLGMFSNPPNRISCEAHKKRVLNPSILPKSSAACRGSGSEMLDYPTTSVMVLMRLRLRLPRP